MKNNYDKINFLYREQKSTYGNYMDFTGLETALRRNGLLHYSYEVSDREPLNMQELLKCPILCIRGSWKPVIDVVKLISGRQFVAEINPEALLPVTYSYLERAQFFKYFCQEKIKNLRLSDYPQMLIRLIRKVLRGPEFPLKDYFEVLKNGAKCFDLYFATNERDLNLYFNKPCYWFPSWVHTELYDDIAKPVSDKIGFIGGMSANRLKFFSQDKNKIIEIVRTVPQNNPIKDEKELCRLINRYNYLVAPMGVRTQTMITKVYEYMACKRSCFCYLNEEQMFRSRLLFEDGKDIVYFKTFAELEEKYRYYLKNLKEAERIAQAGYEKVRKYHNADVRAKWFAKALLHHANGGEYDEAYNNQLII
jgi:hypothetical protein